MLNSSNEKHVKQFPELLQLFCWINTPHSRKVRDSIWEANEKRTKNKMFEWRPGRAPHFWKSVTQNWHKSDTTRSKREANEKQMRSKREAKCLDDVSDGTLIFENHWHKSGTKVAQKWHETDTTRSKREANKQTLVPKPYSSGFIKPQLNPR